MYEINEINKNHYEGICLEDDFECAGTTYEDVEDIMDRHEEEIKKIKAKEQKWLLEGDIRNKLIQLNENIESLIDVAHDVYMSISETDKENRARMDGQIKAYWNVKPMIEEILGIVGGKKE
jgi:hypothetical protein